MNYLISSGQGQKFEAFVHAANLVKIAEIWITLLPDQQLTFVRRILRSIGVTNFTLFYPLLVNMALSSAINKYTRTLETA